MLDKKVQGIREYFCYIFLTNVWPSVADWKEQTIYLLWETHWRYTMNILQLYTVYAFKQYNSKKYLDKITN